MTSASIVPYTACYQAPCVQLYESAFPIDERRPTTQWLHLINHSTLMHTYVVKAGNPSRFAGFATLWHFSHFSYIEHFAISDTQRNSGIGSHIFQQLLNLRPDLPLIIEVEQPTDSISQRRITFYERNGMHILPYNYQQPPYAKELQPLPMRIMANCESIQHDKFEEIRTTIAKEVYGQSGNE